ncbi:hypothetical protein RHA1_ro06573 [Rhodococcus jostii RHA1]|uniref:Uncharacterized protein n=1 Tax=Rhodococcus jostii (strain RHA1) TaxID=101510 RepID=Q0S290_RHOJR|nr:hypothetical protein RHA1_ro06573 [Rhodococcus jostii RHA1]
MKLRTSGAMLAAACPRATTAAPGCRARRGVPPVTSTTSTAVATRVRDVRLHGVLRSAAFEPEMRAYSSSTSSNGAGRSLLMVATVDSGGR